MNGSERKKRHQGRTTARQFPPLNATTKAEVIDLNGLGDENREPGELVDITYRDIQRKGPALPATPDQLAEFYKQNNRSRGGPKCCLAPGCSRGAKDIIKAHSISAAKILSQLAIDGKIWAPHHAAEVGDSGEFLLSSPFKLVGITQASIFLGLCAEHDHALFNIIDDNDVDTDNMEYLFKLAYRAILREVHAQLGSLQSVQGKPLPVIETDIGYIDIFSFKIQVAESILKYKEEIDKMLSAGQWDGLKHEFKFLDRSTPTVAAAALVSLDDVDREDQSMAVYSILPTSEGIIAIFSATETDFPAMNRYLDRHLSAPVKSRRFKNELSKIILRDTYNFVISPKLWDKLSQSRQNQIIDYFLISKPDFPAQHYPSKGLCLFLDT